MMRARPPCENRRLFVYLHRRLFKTAEDMNQAITRNQASLGIDGWAITNKHEHAITVREAPA